MADRKMIYLDDAIDALDALCDRECEYSKQQRGVMCGACRLGSAFDVIDELPSAQPEIIRCKDCMHNGSFDTDCPIDWNGKEYCSFAERKEDE